MALKKWLRDEENLLLMQHPRTEVLGLPLTVASGQAVPLQASTDNYIHLYIQTNKQKTLHAYIMYPQTLYTHIYAHTNTKLK